MPAGYARPATNHQRRLATPRLVEFQVDRAGEGHAAGESTASQSASREGAPAAVATTSVAGRHIADAFPFSETLFLVSHAVLAVHDELYRDVPSEMSGQRLLDLGTDLVAAIQMEGVRYYQNGYSVLN